MKRTGPKTDPWGHTQVRSEGEGFTSFIITCPTLQVRIEERQRKITDIEIVFEASQKNAMIDSVEGSA